MPRLLPGEDSKIDRINLLVEQSRHGSQEAMGELLIMFHPMILKVCKKWSSYFNDMDHVVKRFDDLVADAQYWFIHYTLCTYIVDGRATYNKFIHDHIDQRVRYIYECELKYITRHLLPDPDKNNMISYNDRHEMLEHVIYEHSSTHSIDIEADYIDKCYDNDRIELAHRIYLLLDDREIFSDRDKYVFIEAVLNNRTHDDISQELNISRTRVTQIFNRTKKRLRRAINANNDIWGLIFDADIEFGEPS